jgi:hypothetical protein
MIASLEDLLACSPASGPRFSLGMGPDEYYLVNGNDSEPETVASGLVVRLKRYGILYVYAGALEFNSMALRVLRDMREGGVPLEEEAFRFRVEESKRLYRREHLEELPETELEIPG